MKYERIPVIIKAFGDFKVLGFVSGKTKSEVIKTIKEDRSYNFRNNGLIKIDHPDFNAKINSNKI